MRKRSGLLGAPVLTVTAALILVSVATATPPIPTPVTGTETYAAGEVCSFPLRVEPHINKSHLHILRNGVWVVNGRFTQTATNLRTGASMTFHSGPLRVIFNDDGTLTFISLGSVLWTSVQGDVDGPGLRLYTGRAVIQTDANGFATSISRIPREQDICAALG